MKSIPQSGLGTWKIPKDIVEEIVYQAIKEFGVRHIDCACDYGNEIEVGRGIKKIIDEGILKREDLWITSKLWNTYHCYDHVEMACRKSLNDLQLNYFDLYLIHFPIAMKFVPFEKRYPPEWIYDPESQNPKIELETKAPLHLTWKAMEELVWKGLTSNIGVCNFNVQLLIDLLSYATIVPFMNQIELHPYLPQQLLVNFCHTNNIKCTAFSPLGSPSYIELNMDHGLGKGLLEHTDIIDIALNHKKTPAQVILHWNLQRGIASVIPKSTKLERIAENMAIFDFELNEKEMTKIALLDKKGCVRFNDPGVFCVGMGGAIPIYN